ncbi:MAG: redox-sensing transcriptional repressor Rex [Ruminococcus sp.]|nr:redox-sensing transcriptional repressor Rex [Ruminococcus sp.]
MASNSVSTSVIKRLPRYYRFLGELMLAGTTRISSRELSEKTGLTASQIRQDFNCFGGFGQQGYGYNVAELHNEIGKILGVDKRYGTILIGAGNLGKAMATHMNFEKRGIKLLGIFDSNRSIVGEKVADITISHTDDLDKFCSENQPIIAILCIPKTSAQEIADRLVKLGIKAFWNFSHYDLRPAYSGIIVENVHLGDSLMTLAYGVNNNLNL